MSGPVVQAARKTLDTENINRVLIWVGKEHEAEVRETFKRAMSVRRLTPEAQELADRHFFETVVRLHRATERAPFTGLKTQDEDLGPAILCSDQALEKRDPESLVQFLVREVRAGLAQHFNEAVNKKTFKTDDVEAGRKFMEAYVNYIHYVERLYHAAAEPVEAHRSQEHDPSDH